MKRIVSKKVEADLMPTDTSGILRKISTIFDPIYSTFHASGSAMWIKHDDGMVYEIDVVPYGSGKNDAEVRNALMRSENESDKELFRKLQLQEAKGARKMWEKDWPTDNGEKQSSSRNIIIEAKSPAWQREEGKSDKGGLNEKGRKSYEKENPGSDLKPPVTEDKPTGKRKKRQDSYCARSKGQMDDHNIDCSKDPDKPICKSRKRWNC